MNEQRIKPGTKVRTPAGFTATVVCGPNKMNDCEIVYMDGKSGVLKLSSLEIIEEVPAELEPLKPGQDVWVRAKVSNAIKPARNGYADIIVNDYYYAADGDDPEDAELIRVPISALRRAE